MFEFKKARGVAASAIAGLLATVVVAGVPAQPASAAGLTGSGPIRMGGADRYSTSQAIVKSNFPSATKAVFLATGATFPDALAAGPAAGLLDSPVLLTAATALSGPAAQELNRLRPAAVYVMGGTGAVSNAVMDAARAYSSNVVRISGTDRYGTAVSASKQFWPAAGTVYVASGTGFADALSGGALAAKTDSPVLLTSPTGLVASTKAELQRLAPANVVILGGTGAVSATVDSQIQGALPGAVITRLQGPDRAATSAAIAKAGWGSSAKAMYASGANFPDALAGVAAAAANDAPLLLTNGGCMPQSVWTESERLGVQTKGILGGKGVLSITAVSASCAEAPPFPAASATAREFSGSGNALINISKPDGAASIGMATVTHRGAGELVVNAYDANNEHVGGVLYATGNYAGTAIFDVTNQTAPTAKLEIAADGPWTISIASVRAAPSFGRQTISGHGDAVFNYTPTESREADFHHDGTIGFYVFLVRPDKSQYGVLLSEEGSYSGRQIWPGGPTVVQVGADGNWRIAVR